MCERINKMATRRGGINTAHPVFTMPFLPLSIHRPRLILVIDLSVFLTYRLFCSTPDGACGAATLVAPSDEGLTRYKLNSQ